MVIGISAYQLHLQLALPSQCLTEAKFSGRVQEEEEEMRRRVNAAETAVPAAKAQGLEEVGAGMTGSVSTGLEVSRRRGSNKGGG